MENKKIRNATPISCQNIAFKSKLETMVYKTLIEEGFSPQYEPTRYELWGKQEPTIPFYTKGKFKKLNKHLTALSSDTVKDMRPLSPIHYTPDFVFSHGSKTIFVEAKGMQNDVYPYKMKLFRAYLEQYTDKENYEIWEVYTKRQLLTLIKHLHEES